MTPAQLALRQVEARLLERLSQLEARLDTDETAWPEYCASARTLAAVVGETAPGAHGALLTTAQLAATLNVSAKTILRRRKGGQLAPALQLGARGPAALRWARPSGR